MSAAAVITIEPLASVCLNLQERLERHSHRDIATGCLLWHGATTGRTADGRGGYPELGMADGTTLYAHRLSFLLANGHMPQGSLHHTCEVRSCIEPSHLVEIGSQSTHNRLHAALRRASRVERATPREEELIDRIIDLALDGLGCGAEHAESLAAAA